MDMPAMAPVTARGLDQAMDVITKAFAADPVARWAYPDEQIYHSGFPRFARAFAGRAFEYRTVAWSDRCEGVALWLPPGVEPDDEAMAAEIEAAVRAEMRKDLFAFMDGMARYHPKEPHWYLPMMGVDPARQGRGVGTELMRRGLEFCDSDGAPAYLEATTERSRTLYSRFGFRTLGTIQAGSSPTMFAMLREPRSGSD